MYKSKIIKRLTLSLSQLRKERMNRSCNNEIMEFKENNFEWILKRQEIVTEISNEIENFLFNDCLSMLLSLNK